MTPILSVFFYFSKCHFFLHSMYPGGWLELDDIDKTNTRHILSASMQTCCQITGVQPTAVLK